MKKATDGNEAYGYTEDPIVSSDIIGSTYGSVFDPSQTEIMEAEDQDAMRQQKVKEYVEKFANPFVAAAKGYIDAVIEPQETRELLLHALSVSEKKYDYRPAKKHGIPPF